MRLRRLVMLGPSVVGKSAVTIRFCENTFVAAHLPTIEDTYHASAEVDDQRYACEVKDTAGQDELSLFAAQSSIGVHGYVLLYSVTDEMSFEAIKTINRQLLLTLGSNSVPRVLVGNQIDLEDDREVSYEAGEDLAAELNCPFVECSALTGQNVTDVFHCLLRAIDGQMMPAEEVVAEPQAESQPQGQLSGQNQLHCVIS